MSPQQKPADADSAVSARAHLQSVNIRCLGCPQVHTGFMGKGDHHPDDLGILMQSWMEEKCSSACGKGALKGTSSCFGLLWKCRTYLMEWISGSARLHSASKCHGGGRGTAMGTGSLRKHLCCYVPNGAFLSCPSLLQSQNKTL